jgi:hypothetical protein
MGYLYRPKFKSGRRSDVWWCKYYQNGRPVRESPVSRPTPRCRRRRRSAS